MKNVLAVSPFMKGYYCRHPIQYVRNIFHRLHNGWMRATKGYCYHDLWNIDSWFYDVIPDMLDTFADKTLGYPGDIEFPTPESWITYLHNLANDLRLCTDTAAEQMNEYYAAYLNLSDKSTPEAEELRQKYYIRCREIEREQETIREEAMVRFAHILPRLWY